MRIRVVVKWLIKMQPRGPLRAPFSITNTALHCSGKYSPVVFCTHHTVLWQPGLRAHKPPQLHTTAFVGGGEIFWTHTHIRCGKRIRQIRLNKHESRQNTTSRKLQSWLSEPVQSHILLHRVHTGALWEQLVCFLRHDTPCWLKKSLL